MFKYGLNISGEKVDKIELFKDLKINAVYKALRLYIPCIKLNFTSWIK